MSDILKELKATEDKLRGIKAPRGEGQGYGVNPQALKNQVKQAQALKRKRNGKGRSKDQSV